MANFLTFDLGTTLFKVALFDDAGRLLALERATPPIEHPQPGWAILSSEQVSGLLFATMAALRKNVGEKHWQQIKAVSYATQANTFSLTAKGQAGNLHFLVRSAGDRVDEYIGERQSHAGLSWKHRIAAVWSAFVTGEGAMAATASAGRVRWTR